MAASPKGFSPTFENRGFWEYYTDLERQLTDYLVYVPIFGRKRRNLLF